MKTKLRNDYLIVLAIITASVIFIYFFVNDTIFDFKPMNLPEVNLEDDFTQFALLVIFAFDALPTILQQFSISAITVKLLMTGFSPVILTVIATVGLLTGQMILYTVGMFVRKVHKGSFGDIAGHNHFLHKYHFLVYMMIPFVGILGDGAMIYSGHQRINPLKMIPFLLVSDFASTLRWILPMTAELHLSDNYF